MNYTKTLLSLLIFISLTAQAKTYPSFKFPLDPQISSDGYVSKAYIEFKPIIAGDYVLFGSNNSFLYAIDRTNGTVHWKFKGGWITNGPVAENGTVYFGNYNGELFAVDIQSGKLLWQLNQRIGLDDYAAQNYPGRINLPVNPLTVWGLGQPTVSNGIVFSGGGAYRGSDGFHLWWPDYGTWGGVFTEGIGTRSELSEGILVYHDVYLMGADAKTGKKIWKLDHDMRGGWARGPAIDNGIVYAGTTGLGGQSSQNFFAIGLRTGKVLWSYDSSGITTNPVITDKAIYVGYRKQLYIFDKNAPKALQTPVQFEESMQDEMTLANGMLYLTTEFLGTVPVAIHALDTKTNSIVWSRDIPGCKFSMSPAYADGKLYFGCDEFLYVIDAGTGI
jgi:outer membrane protein assembly factor BamB